MIQKKKFILLLSALLTFTFVLSIGCTTLQPKDKFEETITLSSNINEAYRYELKYGVKITKPNDVQLGTLVYWLAYPISNEYQTIESVTVSSQVKNEIRTYNDNKYIVFYLDNSNFKTNEVLIWIDVVFKSYAFNYNYPQNFTNIKLEKYDKESLVYKDNIKQERYINLENQILTTKANELYSESGNVLEYAFKCYKWIGNNFNYKNPGVGLYSVDKFINQEGGDCGNFSSVFVTMMRIKGIPARHVVIRNTNPDLNKSFHMFSEIYLESYGWFPIDVTQYNLTKNNYFGKFYDGALILHRGINFPLEAKIPGMGIINADHLQLYYWLADEHTTNPNKINNALIWEVKDIE